jgi:hypothetical protein
LGQLVDTGQLLDENAHCCQNSGYKFQKFSNISLLRNNMFFIHAKLELQSYFSLYKKQRDILIAKYFEFETEFCMIMMLKYPSAVAFSYFLLKNGTEHLHRICTLCAFFTGYAPGPTVLGIFQFRTLYKLFCL